MKKHDKYAPCWAIAFATLLVTGLFTINLDLGYFWKGYVLDMVGPAWNYILFRGLFTNKVNNIWTRLFTATNTFLILVFVSIGFETIQYFELYDSTFDGWDIVAYISLLIPMYIIDLYQSKDNKLKSD